MAIAIGDFVKDSHSSSRDRLCLKKKERKMDRIEGYLSPEDNIFLKLYRSFKVLLLIDTGFSSARSLFKWLSYLMPICTIYPQP